MNKVAVILPCGGSGTRAGLGYNKLKFSLGNISIIEKTISAWTRSDIYKIIIACSPQDYDWFRQITSDSHANIQLCLGGDSRSQSVYNALQLAQNCDFVAIHDGARPFVNQSTIDLALNTAYIHGNAVVAIDCNDSLRIIDSGTNHSVDRAKYKLVQTPQIFRTNDILRAYQNAQQDSLCFTDDASLYNHYVGNVTLCQGDSNNIKITTPNDLERFFPSNILVGIGWDTHQLVDGRPLILGGITIPHYKGLLGHSDGDALIHAVIDCILCATNNGNIGILFPDNDMTFKDIDSKILLQKVSQLILSQGYVINNISATIMAQKPKLKDYLSSMQRCIADILNIQDYQFTLTATTTEKLGLVGKEEAISCQTYCSIIKTNT